MKYKAIFIDIDDTLLDYVPCCREAFDVAIEAINQPADEELFQLFFEIAGRLFSEAKHGKYTIAQVMDMYPAEFVEALYDRCTPSDSPLTKEEMTALERANQDYYSNWRTSYVTSGQFFHYSPTENEKLGGDALYMIEPFEPARTRFHAMSAEEAVKNASEVMKKVEGQA